MGCVRRDRKVATTPRNPWEKERLVKELQLVGTHGLKNKTELWTVVTSEREDKKRARTLLINTDKEKFMIHGRALLNKLVKMGLISSVDFNDQEDIRRGLRQVLNIEVADYLERRLQFQVVQAGLAKNVHQARCMIYKKQICVKGRVVTRPSFIIKAEDQGLIEVNPILGQRNKAKATVQDPQDE